MPSSLIRGLIFAGGLGVLLISIAPAEAQQRVLGVDISYWNCGTGATGISQANWNTAFSTPNANGYTRQFAFIRASRGGTTGVDQPQGTPGGGTLSTLSRRYDDPRFVQNITRATAAGMLTGAYHFGRPDVAGNTGTDEANHFIEMAGAWMRPGYLMPVFDLEAGTEDLAQFSLDFSNQIYAEMGIRPAMYINGNHTNHLVNSSTAAQRDQLAKPLSNTPSMVGPAYPMLWNARYADQEFPETIPVQTGNPRTTPTTISSYYGPWDDYGNAQPWSFWQYASTVSIPGINAVDSGVDGNVSQGDIEYVRNYLVPAVWQNDSSGDWSALANWNSGQTPLAPVQAAGQTAPYMTGQLPTPRLPGAAGSGPTSGQYDTVILERPNANVTVTLSTGAHNVRKLYMRETLEINGGSLTVNYDPTYRSNTSATVLHGGPLSAQFSGAVTMSAGSFSVHTLQVDSTRTFTLGGGTLALNRINLMPHASTPAKLLLTGDVNFNPLSNAAAVIANGTGSGNSGRVDLGGGARGFNVGDGSAVVDLTISAPIINGGLTKSGPGTLALTGANTYAGDTIVNAGKLTLGTSFLANSADVYLNSGVTLDLGFTGAADVIDSLYIDGVQQFAGIWGAEGSAAEFTSPLITGTGLLQVSTHDLPPSPADFNGDGRVDGDDAGTWQFGFGIASNAPAFFGDADGDLDVDGHDFLAMQSALGYGVPNWGASMTAIPEPSAVVLAGLAAAGVLANRRRRAS